MLQVRQSKGRKEKPETKALLVLQSKDRRERLVRKDKPVLR